MKSSTSDGEVIAVNVPLEIPRFTNSQRAGFKHRYQAENPLPNGYPSWDAFWNDVCIFSQYPRPVGKAFIFEETKPVTKDDHQGLVRWWMGCFVGLERNRKKPWWKIF